MWWMGVSIKLVNFLKLAELEAMVEQNVTPETIITIMVRNNTNWKVV
jgi:hypothetical protein